MSKKKKGPIDWESFPFETTPQFNPEDYPKPDLPPKPIKLPKEPSEWIKEWFHGWFDKEPIDPEVKEKMKNLRESPSRRPSAEQGRKKDTK